MPSQGEFRSIDIDVPEVPDGEAVRPVPGASPDSAALRAVFAHDRPYTLGIEEEVMLVDPVSLDLAPRAEDALGRCRDDVRFRSELPAAQLEIVLPPAATVGESARALGDGRRALRRSVDGIGVLAGAGVHPFARGEGILSRGERYEHIEREFASVARRQLVFGLHVHVAVPGPDLALAVYNAVREHLPAVAALGAGSPYHEGADSGLASVRPTISTLLPRQGIPPAFASWQEFADALAWGAASGAFPDAAQWWWEARLHPLHGTLEIRAPDTQATVADTAAIAAVCHALVVHLAQRIDGGDVRPPAPSWRIAENRWSACRHGTAGTWRDVRTGRSEPMADHLHGLLEELAPTARALGCERELAHGRDLITRPRAAWAREVVAAAGLRGLVACLADRFIG